MSAELSLGTEDQTSGARMSIDINSPEAIGVIASHLGGQAFDAAGMTVGAFVVHRLIADGTLVNDLCPEHCGGSG